MTRVLPGLHYESVQRGTISVDLFFRKWSYPEGDGGHQIGLDVGQGGCKLRIGNGGWGMFGGSMLGLAVLHTWGKPGVVGAGQTFIGPELHLGLSIIDFGAGYYLRLAGKAAGDSHMPNLTLGVVYPFNW